jgi:hypothetical protein
LTATDLNTCQHLGSLFVCQNTNTRYHLAKVEDFEGELDDRLCPWFLFVNDLPKAQQACPVHLRKLQSDVFALGGGDYVVVEKVDHNAELRCRGSTSQYPKLEGPTRVHVPPGCQLVTRSSTTTATLDLALNTTAVTFRLLHDPKLLLQDLDVAYYKQLAAIAKEQKALHREVVPTDVHEVRRWIAAKKQWAENGANWTDNGANWLENGVVKAEQGVTNFFSTLSHLGIWSVFVLLAAGAVCVYCVFRRPAFNAQFPAVNV